MTENETNTAAAEPVDWDALKVGDPAPPHHGGMPCMSFQPGSLFVCNRKADHGGRQHVAVVRLDGDDGDDGTVVAVWPVDGAA